MAICQLVILCQINAQQKNSKTLLLTQLIKNNIRRFDVNRRTSCSHLNLGYSQTCFYQLC